LNEEELRDCFAMFAMLGLTTKYGNDNDPDTRATESYKMADAMLEARKPKDEAGIASVKRTRKLK
jgi:hypothetical protein